MIEIKKSSSYQDDQVVNSQGQLNLSIQGRGIDYKQDAMPIHSSEEHVEEAQATVGKLVQAVSDLLNHQAIKQDSEAYNTLESKYGMLIALNPNQDLPAREQEYLGLDARLLDTNGKIRDIIKDKLVQSKIPFVSQQPILLSSEDNSSNSSSKNSLNSLTLKSISSSVPTNIRRSPHFTGKPDLNADWQNLSIEKGIPLVDGQRVSRQADFELLSKLTAVSKLTIGRFLGEMIEEVPLIKKECFDLLSQSDPFEPGKCFKDTFEILVIPSWIRRTKEKQWTLDEEGSLIPDPKKQEKTLDIVLTLKNLRILCSSPLNGKENMPVFNKRSLDNAFDCKRAQDHASIYFTRKQLVGRNLTCELSKEIVEAKKLEVTPLFKRAWAHCFSILEFNTCLDNKRPWTYAWTPDIIRLSKGENCHLAIGGFSPGAGMLVGDIYFADDHIGCAPGFSGEVWPS